MAYEVLARKYRPQQFDEVVGQAHVTRTLKNAIASNRVAHAYLFVGPRGIGKTSISRILAKALNCENGPTATPCGVCDACREIMAGQSLDVLEIDGASNNGVDQVRDLRDKVRYAPARGAYKIYIIDEVHMLSLAAFNALLKTLEEPPAHAKFIFATTEPQKVPATIASRCQRFDLRRIPTRDIMAHLAKIAAAEGVTIGPDALLAIARGAEGGLRDAESALDQLIAFRGKTIEEEDVLAVFSLVSREALEALAAALLRGDVPALLSDLDGMDAAGKDLPRLVLELLDYFRDLLVLLHGDAAAAALDLPDSRLQTLRGHAAGTDAGRILRLVEILMETEGRLRYATSRRTLLETALIRCARAATHISLDGILRQLQTVRDMLGDGATDAPAAANPPPAPAEVRRTVATPPAAPPPPTAAPTPAPAQARDWPALRDRLIGALPQLRATLQGSRLLESSADRVIIGLDPAAAPDPGRAVPPALMPGIRKILGGAPTVIFQPLENRPAPAAGTAAPMSADADEEDDPAAEGSSPDAETDDDRPATAEASPEAPTAPAGPGVRTALLDNPNVRRALDLFDGTIDDIRT